jgi:hypothetical protein
MLEVPLIMTWFLKLPLSLIVIYHALLNLDQIIILKGTTLLE